MFQRAFSVFLSTCLSAILAVNLASAQETGRRIVTSENGDYYGFDISTATDVTLDQCENICLANRNCRAFTFNSKVNWCFLKSDFGRLQASDGSIAGRVIETGAEPDLGAAPDLDFASRYKTMATNYRSNLMAAVPADFSESAGALEADAKASMTSGNARAALKKYGLAAALAPEDSGLWAGTARAALAIVPRPDEARNLREAAASAAFNAYQVSRTVSDRAGALALMGEAEDGRFHLIQRYPLLA